jgi:homogentisate 1,2-dioxygenase
MPVTKFAYPEKYNYMNGFGCNFEYICSQSTYRILLILHRTEAIQGALPIGQNSPQKCPMGLYAEKISGTSFTAPRKENQQAWVYRILPSASHSSFQRVDSKAFPLTIESFKSNFQQIPNQLRWDPFDMDHSVAWVDSLHLLAGAGDPVVKSGVGYYIYAAGKSMDENTAFYNADGDFLIVPQEGILDIETEMGNILVRPQEICVIPRGIRHRVSLPNGPARGYIMELYQGHFSLPELGPIGSNCLANERDFQTPVARYTKDTTSTWTLLGKLAGNLFKATQNHTPFDVVAWHGTFYPYKYDLGRYNTIGTISYDHPDPSIYTVLTAETKAHPGTAIADFVVFPPRWLVGEDTFRPPSYHRNTMSEFMGLISGSYMAKSAGRGGFQAGGASLHNVMSSHGPDVEAFEKASNEDLVPVKVGQDSMAFMFESCYMVGLTEWGLKTSCKLQEDYSAHSWADFKVYFEEPGNEVNGQGKRDGMRSPLPILEKGNRS